MKQYIFYLEDTNLFDKLNQYVNGKLKLKKTYEAEIIIPS